MTENEDVDLPSREIVAVTGEGTADLLALQRADIGFGMVIRLTDIDV